MGRKMTNKALAILAWVCLECSSSFGSEEKMRDVRSEIGKVGCPYLEGPGILENIWLHFQYSLKWGEVTAQWLVTC